MNRPLSACARSEILKDLESATFDLLIIGGGITGAGIAWDAAKRGMKTALIEQNDFAFGTSSRSTKLIHGGLRYLKKGEVKLVREVGREREWLYRHAPHLVTPMPMLLPIYKGGTFGYWSTSIGLYIYDRLAGVRRPERRVMHKGDEAVRLEPFLKREGLKGAGRYYEYRSDDARLTVEVLKTAARHGAWAINYVEATDFIYYQSKVAGVRAIDKFTGAELEIRAKTIVNAAGPWVDLVRSKDHAIKGKNLMLTKGVHLVVDHSKLPVRQAAYFDVPDGRMIFVIPRDGKTYIGTTDTAYSGDPAAPRTTEKDVDYLIQAVKGVFPHVKLTPRDVEAMWAGLRPLIREEGKSPSDVSRKDEIWVSSSGLITIAGGKLTGFRRMAEKAVDAVADSLSRESSQSFGPCTTSKEVLSGGDSGRSETYEELRDELIRLGVRKGLKIATATYLVKQYGSNAADIFMRMEGLETRFEALKARPEPWKESDKEERAAEPELSVTAAVRIQEEDPEFSEMAAVREQAEDPENEVTKIYRAGELLLDNAGSSTPEPEALDGAVQSRTKPEQRGKGRGHSREDGSRSDPSGDIEWKVLAAEVCYGIEEEMVVNADDFLVRRTGLLYFDRERAEKIALDVLDIMAERLGWNDKEILEQKRRISREWEAATAALGKEV